jgi:hypothetical protein
MRGSDRATVSETTLAIQATLASVQIGFPAPHMDVQVSCAVQGRTNVAERMDARERLGQGWPGATRFVERRLSPLGPPAIIRKARI